MILVLDNRDSFTFNLVQALSALGAQVRVERSDSLDWPGVAGLGPRGILIGPGPGIPARAGCSENVVRNLGDALPILGVCLGHQSLATAFGGDVVTSGDLVHGQTRSIDHDGRGVLRGLPSPLQLARYNSLTVDEETLPAELEISARGPRGEIMGLRHRELPLEGVQFHPESILCIEPYGRRLLGNFVELCGALNV